MAGDTTRWNWRITAGEMWLLDDSPHCVAHGYSGFGEGKNNPALAHVKDVGPIPPGTYTIIELRAANPGETTKHGPYVLVLQPDPANEMFGRSEFLIHGDSIPFPGTASHGCVILPRSTRELIWKSGIRTLIVTV